ncbi:MAG: mechanosensitive ion channel family protein [Sulfurospirillum sp.]|nr:MAG: mechanosensitive ion channel family protein [Sulfurospirillum sp.]
MKIKTTLLLLLCVVLFPLYAVDNNSTKGVKTAPTTENNETEQTEKANLTIEEAKARIKHNQEIQEQLEAINDQLKTNLLYAKYNNHQVYLDLQNQLKEIRKKLHKSALKPDTPEFMKLKSEEETLENQISLLKDFKYPPFEELTKPKDIAKAPEIKTPFDILNGFRYLKLLKTEREDFNRKLEGLYTLIELLKEKKRLLKKDTKIKHELDEILPVYHLAKNTYALYAKKVEDSKLKVTSDIKVQMQRLFNILITIGVIILFSFIFKYLAKKTITDNQRYYMANKIINFSNFFLIMLVLLFSFLENMTYFVTVLGFASAGIAIAMKDLFMSALGWMVIVFGGSFHVGDRVKVFKGKHEYVGDIIDISFLRMTILEDVTLTTYTHNRRAGRIIFIPNNYIFTELLANYTHGKIKTVWDGVDVMITFDSNYKKAQHLVREIVKKYSKGYTEISRKQLNMLRSQYSLKNINVEPRVYTFMEEYGVKISCWYMTNSYATLTLRSNIYSNILDALMAEEDIKIAYPTQIVNFKKDAQLEPKDPGEQSIS